jgi:hypothetical protein
MKVMVGTGRGSGTWPEKGHEWQMGHMNGLEAKWNLCGPFFLEWSKMSILMFLAFKQLHTVHNGEV